MGGGARTPRRRRGPSPVRLFLALATVLGWAFDASVVLRRARRGPWRVEIAEGSMAPALRPGDWLLVDPTGRRWPRPGSIVVVREPDTGILAIKRVAARGRRRAGAYQGGSADAADRGRVGAAGTGAPGGPDAGGVARRASAAGGGAATAPVGLQRPLEPREAWLLGDSRDGSIDSRTYGPLDADMLVARAWFRYGPPGRIGRVR